MKKPKLKLIQLNTKKDKRLRNRHLKNKPKVVNNHPSTTAAQAAGPTKPKHTTPTTTTTPTTVKTQTTVIKKKTNPAEEPITEDYIRTYKAVHETVVRQHKKKRGKRYYIAQDVKEYFLPTDSMFRVFERRGFVLQKNMPFQRRVFIDNGADILFVAHLDTVQKPEFKRFGMIHQPPYNYTRWQDGNYFGGYGYNASKNTEKTRKEKKKEYPRAGIYASGLDDRLGVYTALRLVYSYGLKADILFCDLEESCKTTAQFHTCKDYKWVAEFDRAGEDVVHYGLTSDEWTKELKAHFEVGTGSFSDVCRLDTKACCVNVGIGYHSAHAINSHCDVNQHEEMINKFIKFYEANKDKEFKREEKFKFASRFDDDYYYDYENVDGGLIIRPHEATRQLCDFCKISEGRSVFGVKICRACFDFALSESSIDVFRNGHVYYGR